jgi:hypothetical protein
METVPTTSHFEGLAAELAASPGLLEALLAEHRDDCTGHCQSCTTTPGYGRRDVPMPCPLGRLAEFADRLHPRRSER